MNEPLRILLRLLGAVLFVASLAGVVVIVGVGPDEIGQKMGKNCRHINNGPSENCTWQDALGILQAMPWICLVGAVLMFTMRRDWVGRDADKTEDQVVVGGASGIHAIGVLALILVIAGTFVGVFVYRAGYAIAEVKEVSDKLRDAPRPNLDDPGPAAKKAPAAPRGLAQGSLLRADRFRAALAEIRRAAPAGAELSGLRVAADRIDAELLAGGKVVDVRKAWNAKATVESTDAATGGDTALTSFGKLDPAAPQRAVRSAAGRPRDVDYLVLFDAVGLRWNGFFVEGRGQFSAAPDGSPLS